MGWIIFLENYFSLAWIGIVIRFLYSIYTDIFKQKNYAQEANKPITGFIGKLTFNSLKHSILFGIYAFALLIIFALLSGIGITTWAIIRTMI